MTNLIHTSFWGALRDRTTWAAGIIAAAIGTPAFFGALPDPWASRAQAAAVVIGLVGTLLRGPEAKPREES